jgi:hypothetical protein
MRAAARRPLDGAERIGQGVRMSDDEDQPGGSRQTIAAVVVLAVLVVAGWWLMAELKRHSDVQNCIQSGRRDCVPIETGK